jgi:nicotinate phosphoribosyltransferase
LAKTSIPGILQVRRFRVGDEYRADMIVDELSEHTGAGLADSVMVDPMDATRRKVIAAGTAHEELLVPIFRKGRLVYAVPELGAIRKRAQEQLAGFHAGVKRGVHPHQYPVGLEKGLYDLRQRMILEERGVPA